MIKCFLLYFADTDPEQDLDGQLENETDPDCKILEGLFTNPPPEDSHQDDISPRASPTNSGKKLITHTILFKI